MKQKLLEDERLKLAKALNVVEEQKKALKKLENELENIRQEMQNSKNNREINVVLMSNYSSYSRKLVNDIQLQNESLNKANNLLANQQKQVNIAYIGVKTLEKLKEKQKQAYIKECLQEEFKLLDDLASSKRKVV